MTEFRSYEEDKGPNECWLIRGGRQVMFREKCPSQSNHYHQIRAHKVKFVLLYLALQDGRHADINILISTDGKRHHGLSHRYVRIYHDLLIILCILTI